MEQTDIINALRSRPQTPDDALASSMTHQAETPEMLFQRKLVDYAKQRMMAPVHAIEGLKDLTQRAMSGEQVSEDPTAGFQALRGMSWLSGLGKAPGGATLTSSIFKKVGIDADLQAFLDKLKSSELEKIKPLGFGTPKEQIAHFMEQQAQKGIPGKVGDATNWVHKNFEVEDGAFKTNIHGYAIPKSHVMEFHEDNPAASIADLAGYPEYTKFEMPKYSSSQEKIIEKALGELQPANWQSQAPLLGRRGPNALSSLVPNTTLDELGRQGYNPSLPLYKGYTSQGFKGMTEFKDPSRYAESGGKKYEPALFFGDDPNVAENYSQHGMGTFFASPKNPMSIDWRSVAPNYGYSSRVMEPLIEAAKQKGADFLTIKEMEDIGSNGLQNQYLMLSNPGAWRFNNAQFDPTKKGMSGLLLGAAGAGMALPQVIDALRSPQ